MTMLIAASAQSRACDLPEIGSGRVASVIDGRTIKLDDDREIRLTGIELSPTVPARDLSRDALDRFASGKTVTLRGESDAPDRYGRQHAIVQPTNDGTTLQIHLLALGAAIVSPLIPAACAPELRAAEAEAKAGRRGLWASVDVIKNTERPGDIASVTGQFAVAEGRVRSVREAGNVIYVNFGRRWSEDFALTVPKRMEKAFEAGGITLKLLENRKVRVRGWVAGRNAPAMPVFRVEQIEMLGDNESRSGLGRVFGRNGTSEQ